jgi:cytochrome P450
VRKCDLTFIIPFVDHRLPCFWRDPDRFDPERFAAGGEGTNNEAYITFGVGPRKCIGDRLALMSVGTILPMLLSKRQFSSKATNLRPRGGIPLATLRR